MKAVFLSIVVVCALVVAGIGGTLAGFSDTEQSLNNVFEVGNLDLKVSVGDFEYDDPDVPAIVGAYLAWPCVSQDFSFDLHNLSDNPQPAHVYLTIKNITHYEVETAKHPDGRPEPEVVAEEGGTLANQTIPAMGAWGQNCTLSDFIEVVIYFDTDGDGDLELVVGNPVWGGAGTAYLSDLWDGVWDEPYLWFDLGEIPGCQTRDGKIEMHISNWSEEMWDARASQAATMPIMPPSGNLFPNDKPFNDWLTNLFMSDGANFEILFALTQGPMPPDQVWD